MPKPVTLTFDDTELQMLHEGLKRVRPFADLSPELAIIEETLEERMQIAFLDSQILPDDEVTYYKQEQAKLQAQINSALARLEDVRKLLVNSGEAKLKKQRMG